MTLAYLLASLLTLSVTLNFALLERRLHRRRVVTLGGVLSIGSALIFWFGSGYEMAVAIGLQKAAGSLFAICLSLSVARCRAYGPSALRSAPWTVTSSVSPQRLAPSTFTKPCQYAYDR